MSLSSSRPPRSAARRDSSSGRTYSDDSRRSSRRAWPPLLPDVPWPPVPPGRAPDPEPGPCDSSLLPLALYVLMCLSPQRTDAARATSDGLIQEGDALIEVQRCENRCKRWAAYSEHGLWVRSSGSAHLVEANVGLLALPAPRIPAAALHGVISRTRAPDPPASRKPNFPGVQPGQTPNVLLCKCSQRMHQAKVISTLRCGASWYLRACIEGDRVLGVYHAALSGPGYSMRPTPFLKTLAPLDRSRRCISSWSPIRAS